jgi:hypothetical protein
MQRWRATRGDAAFVAGLVAVIAIPIVAGAVALRRPVWSPVLDLAMTELRVRDVGGAHTPLIGLPGRIEANGVQGSHPGPLSFWLLAPGYRLVGASPWALHLATAVLDLVATTLAVGLAQRLGGRRAALAVALAIALLVVGYGLGPVLEPWNPYLPLLWWVAFLVALWGTLLGDRPSLLVLVGAGSLCAQTHVPYLGLCAGLIVVGAAGAWWHARRTAGTEARDLGRWLAGAAILGVVLWVPVVMDQVVHEPGNLRILADHFATPPEEPIGPATAFTEVLEHFDLGHLVLDQLREPGLLARGELGRFPVAWRGAVFLLGWAATAALAWRSSPRPLRTLHVVIAASTVLGWYSVSRVFGVVWYYLTLWLWAVAVAAVIATAWSVALLWRRARPEGSGAARSRQALAITGIVALVLLSVRAAVTAPDTEPSDRQLSLVLRALVPDTVAALDRGEGPATGREGRYIVGFDDALHIGSQAYGLVTELERAGFDAGMDPAFKVPITDHRTLEPEEATARVELVTGPLIEQWRDAPGAVEVATVDLRTPAQLEELARLRTEVEPALRAEGLAELVPFLDTNLFRAAIDQRASEPLRVKMDRMLKIGLPTSIFVAPPELESP